MKSCVVTQALGDQWLEVLALTRPRMEAYCKRTEQDFISIEKPLAHPVQYTKLVIGNLMATRGYDQVTFLDADVLVALDCDDISQVDGDFDFLAFNEGDYLDRKKGLADLAKTYGFREEGDFIFPRFYFNTGVFVIRKNAIGALSQPPLGLFPNHFAEQTWLNLQLHLWGTKTLDLDPAYNCMTSVEEHFGLNRYKDAYMIHYAGQSNDMAKLRGQIEADIKKLEEEIR
jgi:lipopolysaccharide biosynthesis glycosyltransferase